MPKPAVALVHDADRRLPLRHVQTKKTGRRAASADANDRATAPGSCHQGGSTPPLRLLDVHTPGSVTMRFPSQLTIVPDLSESVAAMLHTGVARE